MECSYRVQLLCISQDARRPTGLHQDSTQVIHPRGETWTFIMRVEREILKTVWYPVCVGGGIIESDIWGCREVSPFVFLFLFTVFRCKMNIPLRSSPVCRRGARRELPAPIDAASRRVRRGGARAVSDGKRETCRLP